MGPRMVPATPNQVYVNVRLLSGGPERLPPGLPILRASFAGPCNQTKVV